MNVPAISPEPLLARGTRTTEVKMRSLSFDCKAAPDEDVAYALSEVPLKLDGPVLHGAAAARSALDVLAELFQECGIAWESVDDGDRFPTAARSLDAQFRDNPRGHGFVDGLMTTVAVVERLSAFRANASGAGRIHHSDVVAVSHAVIHSSHR
jgi:hypothetical protein